MEQGNFILEVSKQGCSHKIEKNTDNSYYYFVNPVLLITVAVFHKPPGRAYKTIFNLFLKHGTNLYAGNHEEEVIRVPRTTAGAAELAALWR